MSNLPRNADEYRQWYLENIPDGVKWGECWCGCGTETKISIRNQTKKYWFVGLPRKFAPQHSKRLDERYKVENRGYITPCHMWTGYIHESGYGMLPHKLNGTNYAHRWRYEAVHGKQPSFPEHQLHHECEQKSCINPQHLALLSVTTHRRTYNTTLTHDDAQEIRLLYATGDYMQKDLAQMFAVDRVTVTRILSGYIWR